MADIDYAIDPARYGLPTYEELVDLRIWSLHFHGFDVMEKVLPYIKRMGIERLFSLDIGGKWYLEDDASGRDELIATQVERLGEWKDLVFGIIRIDPGQPEESVALMERWIANGPVVGIKYAGAYSKDITASHPNNDPIIRKAADLDAVIYIHSSYEVGGDPRYIGGGNAPGESTPEDVATLASRFPDVPLIAGHQGVEWELGSRAIRPHENVFLEFSAMDPESGAVDYAVKELGVDRIVWGGHASSRSYANALSQVFDADLTHAQRKKILGANLRQLAAPILKRKGYEF